MQIHNHWEGNIFNKRGFTRQFDTVDRNNLGNLAQHRALKVSAVIVVVIEEKQRCRFTAIINSLKSIILATKPGERS